MWETKRNIKTNSNGGNKDMKCRDEEVRGEGADYSQKSHCPHQDTSTTPAQTPTQGWGGGQEEEERVGEKKRGRWKGDSAKRANKEEDINGRVWKMYKDRERERKVAEVVYKELLKRALNLRVTWCSKCKWFWAVSCLNEHTVNIMQVMTIFHLIPLFFVENMDVYVIRMNLIRVKGSNTVRATWRLSASWSECSGERKSTRADGLLNRRRNCTWSAGWVTVRPQTLTDNLTNIQKEQQVKEL